MASTIVPTGREIHFGDDEVIVSKTDLKGHITYANDVFVRVSGFSEAEISGKPHNLIRHPDMPGCVFQLLWETIARREEIFAYVLNIAKNGGHYWVFAHVTPSFDLVGTHVGYHSNRRVPYTDALPAVKSLYSQLSTEEKKHANRKQAVEASSRILRQVLTDQNKSYSEFVFGLSRFTALGVAA